MKFNVNDLLRCCFSGNKQQIEKIYNKLEQLDSKEIIEIIKIKNRFETVMKDVMIFFKLKGCFIIC